MMWMSLPTFQKLPPQVIVISGQVVDGSPCRKFLLLAVPKVWACAAAAQPRMKSTEKILVVHPPLRLPIYSSRIRLRNQAIQSFIHRTAVQPAARRRDFYLKGGPLRKMSAAPFVSSSTVLVAFDQ